MFKRVRENRCLLISISGIGIGVVCIGIIVCLAVGQAVGVIPRGFETNTAEAEERQAARSTDRAIQDMTATIIALTPSSTPTSTSTPTDTHTPTRTFTSTETDIPTRTATATNSLEPTDTPPATNTTTPTIVPSSTIKSVENTTRYTTQQINVRSGPSVTFDRIGSLPAGYKLTVLGEQDGWYQIEFANGVGWVAGEYTSTNAPSPSNSGGPIVGPTQFTCPSNCTDAIAMGLTAEQAAACGLDRDGDGVACYGE